MEKIDRSVINKQNGKQKAVWEQTQEMWDKLDEIVDWINKQEAKENDADR